MNNLQNSDSLLHVRFALPHEASIIVDYMYKLGKFQNMLDSTSVTQEDMYTLLTEKHGEAIFGEYEGKIVGFTYFCTHSSAFIGKCALYMDAFYVDESVRSKGFGKVMMAFLAKIALDRGFKRLEWACLDWNEGAITFYKNLGSKPIDILTLHRLEGDA